MKSVMSHQFSQVPQANIPRSSFERNAGYKTTFDAGLLIPFVVDEALPGDSFNVDVTAFARMATPIFPIMDNLYMDTQFFAVPYRLVWDNFQKFMGEQTNPGDSTDYQVPVMDVTQVPLSTTGYLNSTIHDYMGLPTEVPEIEHSCLWHRAYNLIWNEWYRDQNLQDSLTVNTDDGPDDPADYELKRRCKRHDYFTSGLPFPQKGDSIEIPLAGTAPIQGTGGETQVFTAADSTVRDLKADTTTGYIFPTGYSGVQSNLKFTADYNEIGLEANLAQGSGIGTINQLRQAFQIQKLLERDARGGTRYTEIVKAHFSVTSPDQRLQRPEYLGGGSTPVNINPVVVSGQVSAFGGGETAAYSTTTIRNNGFTKSFTEHTLIIGIVSVRADLTYQQGLDRMWSRSTRYDFYWPALAQIGEQSILNKEIYAQGSADPTADEDVFAYQERFAEYRYRNSKITGQFRSNYTSTLDSWHLSQEFSSLPELNDTFIQENPPVDRVISTPAEPHFIFDSYIKMRCARPMPLYGVPGMIDHF